MGLANILVVKVLREVVVRIGSWNTRIMCRFIFRDMQFIALTSKTENLGIILDHSIDWIG